MNSLKNALFSVLNVLLVAAVLACIVFGLWKIGLLEPPAFLASWFGVDGRGEDGADGGVPAGFLKDEDENADYTVIKAEMTPESVRAMLTALEPEKTYVHDLEYTVYSGGVGAARRVVLAFDTELSLAYYISPGAGAYKQIIEHHGITSVSVLDGEDVRTVTMPTGDVGFAGQVGVILTHEDFLATAGDSEYTYSLLSGDDGTLMLITFTSQSAAYTQTQTYKLNLDYGVVTEANCYENGSLVYALSTNSLSKDGFPDFEIPAGFEALIPADSAVSEQQ